jgi:hypothetical protein
MIISVFWNSMDGLLCRGFFSFSKKKVKVVVSHLACIYG